MKAEQIKNLLPPEIQSITTCGELPTDVDIGVAIVESGGTPGMYFSGNRIDTPIVKVAVRDPDFQRGYACIKACKEILTGYADAKVLGIVLINDIMYFGRDAKRRNLWQLTFKNFFS